MISKIDANKMTASEFNQLGFYIGIKNVSYDIETNQIIIEHNEEWNFKSD